MSRQFWLGLFLFAVCAFGMDVDSLPVWDPSLLARSNSFVQNSDTAARRDSIETHGYKTVQVTVGDGGTQVDQELRLSIQGRLTDSVYIDALLSDVDRKAGDQTTATLQEVDQIYFRVESPYAMLHLGDLTWTDNSMGLTSFSRSTLGAMATLRYHGSEVSGAWGTDEVTRYSRSFSGVQGQREGYHLDESGGFISVVPNSERVWLNGVELVRNRDYEVNYAGGLLDFKNGIIPGSDDDVRVEYDAYLDNDIYTMYAARGSLRFENVFFDVSGFAPPENVGTLGSTPPPTGGTSVLRRCRTRAQSHGFEYSFKTRRWPEWACVQMACDYRLDAEHECVPGGALGPWKLRSGRLCHF